MPGGAATCDCSGSIAVSQAESPMEPADGRSVHGWPRQDGLGSEAVRSDPHQQRADVRNRSRHGSCI